MKNFLLLITLLIFVSCRTVDKEEQPYLLILSMDGCRWDYPDMYRMPTLDSMASVGVKSTMKPSFPTKTFPNHYTMATGLYPSNSGIVSNTFYHPELDLTYKISDRATVEDTRFYKGEPFWVSAEQQGIRTASYFWVGSEAKVKGLQPYYWKKFTADITPRAIVDSVVGWLEKPEELRPHLVSFYFYQPDVVGHHYGPESIATKKVVEGLDSTLAYLFKRIHRLDISKNVNVIITSDHGMGAISPDKTVVLSEYITSEDIEYCLGSNPHFLIEPKADKLQDVYEKLSAIEGITVWKKEEVPYRLRYRDSELISSLVVVADSAWSVHWEAPKHVNYGTHGYDNCNEDMKAIFYACGPDFKEGHVHPGFPNVDLYELVCRILDIEAAPNDGCLHRVEGMLKQ